MEPPERSAHSNLSKNREKIKSLATMCPRACSKSGVRLPNFARSLQQKRVIESRFLIYARAEESERSSGARKLNRRSDARRFRTTARCGVLRNENRARLSCLLRQGETICVVLRKSRLCALQLNLRVVQDLPRESASILSNASSCVSFWLLPTPPLGDAVSFSYGQPVLCPMGTSTPLVGAHSQAH